MPALLTPEQVYLALLPVLGPVAGDPSIREDAADLLRSFRPGRETAAEMAKRMEKLLFDRLYRLLGQRMLYQTPDGTVHHVRLEDVKAAADASLEPLLDGLVHCEANFQFLSVSAFPGGCVSAMCVLLRRYPKYLTPDERLAMTRVISGNGRPLPASD